MTPAAGSADVPGFLFATCQLGAENTLKAEVLDKHTEFRFAYSRPGYLTFKLPTDFAPAPAFELNSIFARAWGYSFCKLDATSIDTAAKAVVERLTTGNFAALHVWQRDTAAIGHRGFEPRVSAAALSAEAAIQQRIAAASLAAPARVARPGDLVLDCILVEPDAWWLGQHWATPGDGAYPGGLRTFELPEPLVSRAYIKMQEALAWAAFPTKAGQVFAEIGCAPGGASQALLERGFNVLGIDPAEVAPTIAAHPRFTHIRKRGADVRRRVFRGVHWLAADMNVAPRYTLDTVEDIVTHEAVDIEGLLLTLKLLDWRLADEVPAYLERIKSWGYRKVGARQLPHNRQEICIAALRRKSRPQERRS